MELTFNNFATSFTDRTGLDIFNFIVEIERRHWDRIKEEKYPRLKQLKLPKHDTPRILLVYVDPTWNSLLRPQEYGDTSFVDENFDKLVKATDFKNHEIRLMPFYLFHRLNESVWRKPDGSYTQLINNG